MTLRRGRERERIKAVVFLMFSVMILVSCGKEKGLRVAVAANFSAAAEELKKEYQKLNTGTEIEIIIGSSGKLTLQIMHGAPYDIFFSADMKRPEKLWKKGLAANRPLPYAYGRLILLSGKKWKGEMTLKRAIEETGERIILANPELAPYGKAAMEVLKKTGMFASVKPGLVTAENVVQSARYALLGKGTCFTALSLLNAPAFRKREREITWIEIDKKLYGEIKQGVVILSKSKKTETAKSFFDFVLNSKQAKRTIRHYGYTPAGEYLQGKKR